MRARPLELSASVASYKMSWLFSFISDHSNSIESVMKHGTNMKLSTGTGANNIDHFRVRASVSMYERKEMPRYKDLWVCKVLEECRQLQASSPAHKMTDPLFKIFKIYNINIHNTVLNSTSLKYSQPWYTTWYYHLAKNQGPVSDHEGLQSPPRCLRAPSGVPGPAISPHLRSPVPGWRFRQS